MHKLTFLPKFLVEHTADDLSYIQVHMQPQVDGFFLMNTPAQYCFDFDATVKQGIASGSFYPFTCSCGSPECAGIETPAQLVCSEQTVTWVFPLDPFKDTLNLLGAKDFASIEFVFDKKQYINELQAATVIIENLDNLNNLPVHTGITPYSASKVVT